MGGVGETVLDVVLEDDLRGRIKCTSHGGKLDEHLGAIAAVLDHAADALEVADGAAEAVEHGAGLGVRVAVRDEAAVGQLVGVFVHGVHLTNILRFVRAFVKKVYTR